MVHVKRAFQEQVLQCVPVTAKWFLGVPTLQIRDLCRTLPCSVQRLTEGSGGCAEV